MPELKFIINYYLDVEHTRVTAGELANGMANDPALALMKLKEWHGRGWIKLLSNPIAALPDVVCVEIIGHIDDEKPWSDPMSGKM